MAYVEIDNRKSMQRTLQRLEARQPGEHIWIVSLICEVTHIEDGEGSRFAHAVLDINKVLHISPAGCMLCERAWTPELEKEPCPAERPPAPEGVAMNAPSMN